MGGAQRREGFGGDDERGRAQASVDLQKKSLVTSERDEEARSDLPERLREVDPNRLVFVDEYSTNVALTTRYAGAPKGERAKGSAPRN